LKSKYQNIVSAAAAAETAISLCLQEKAGTITSCNTTALVGITGGITQPKFTGSGTAAMLITAGAAITATSTAEAGTKTFINTPTVPAGGTQIVWTQTGNCLAAKYCK
jgi:hypothetical protein